MSADRIHHGAFAIARVDHHLMAIESLLVTACIFIHVNSQLCAQGLDLCSVGIFFTFLNQSIDDLDVFGFVNRSCLRTRHNAVWRCENNGRCQQKRAQAQQCGVAKIMDDAVWRGENNGRCLKNRDGAGTTRRHSRDNFDPETAIFNGW